MQDPEFRKSVFETMQKEAGVVAEVKRREADEKRAQEARAKQAEQAVRSARPGATISLFGFGKEIGLAIPVFELTIDSSHINEVSWSNIWKNVINPNTSVGGR